MSGLPRIITRLPIRKASTNAQDANAIWKEVNRLGSEGKWDSINNMPKMFLFGKAKRETYAAYRAINHKTDVWSSSPYGQFAKAIFRLVMLAAGIKAGCLAYELIVPEEKRLHYKYRAKHGHHGDEHGHH
ncbi:unnamed protein product [Nippostrongylus brasiliensis]|uniref:ATP synthase subunit g, mitochondrial n=1 Tax=Nippostrongylus brasiliensis TaxID=27835 RepID=A0A0N4YFA6_NIPBR|nr:unnamed protein product [Nippostrongylus brasiliensis]